MDRPYSVLPIGINTFSECIGKCTYQEICFYTVCPRSFVHFYKYTRHEKKNFATQKMYVLCVLQVHRHINADLCI